MSALAAHNRTIDDSSADVAPERLRLLRRTLRTGRGRVGMLLTLFILLVAFVGPLFAPHSITGFTAPDFSGPSSTAPLGTDYLGRDVLSRLLHGGTTVVWMSVSSTALGVAIGTLLGMAAAYVGGFVGALVMRTVDVLLAFPYIVLVLLFISIIGPKTWLLVVMVAFVWVPVVARFAQASTLECVSQEYVQAAEAIGLRRREILLREILPNLATSTMVQFGQYLTWSIGLIAGLSFLGFGVQPPTADWGLMVNENRQGLATQPWAVIAPILMIAIFTVGTNLLTEGFSRALAGIEDAEAQ